MVNEQILNKVLTYTTASNGDQLISLFETIALFFAGIQYTSFILNDEREASLNSLCFTRCLNYTESESL